MILKEDVKNINQLLSDIEKHVKIITGYEIKLVVKETAAIPHVTTRPFSRGNP